MSKAKKKSKKTNPSPNQPADEDKDPLSVIVEDFEKFKDVARSFGNISEIVDPDTMIQTYIDFSRFLTSTGRFAEAKHYAKMIEDSHDNPDLIAECARIMFVHHDYVRCIDLNRKALLHAGGEIHKIQSDIGLALLRNGDTEAAIAQLEKTIDTHPSFAPSYINLALCFRAQFDNARALSSLENALKLDQNDPRIYSNIGIILHDDGKFEDAVVNFLRALEIEAEDAETLSNLGLSLMKIN